jgi:hypothetical protein
MSAGTTTFPTTLDANVVRTNADEITSTDHNDHSVQIEAVEAKVGATSSAVTTSHDYKLSGVTGTDKAVSKTGTETLTNKVIVNSNNVAFQIKNVAGVAKNVINKDASDQTTIGENNYRATRFVAINPVAVVSSADPSTTNWYDADCTASTSANTYAVTGTAIIIATTANRTLHARNNTDSTAQGAINQVANNPVVGVAGVSAFTTGVDTGQIFEWSVDNADVTIVYFIIRGYWEYVD